MSRARINDKNYSLEARMNTFLTITLGLAITTTSAIADSLIKKAKEEGLESIPSSHVALMSMINDPHNTLSCIS